MSPGPHFGEKVIGRENYDKAVRENKGGSDVFGKRVRDAIPEDGPVSEKKRATEHGPLVVNDVEPHDGVSIEDLKRILGENPTFLDSLYEAELARPDGARPEALEVFLGVEIGTKGAGRQEIIDEIRGLLGVKKITQAGQANVNALILEQRDAIEARSKENALLADAPRARAMAQREDDLAFVEKARGEGSAHQGDPLAAMDSQRTAMAEERGLDIGGTPGGVTQSVDKTHQQMPKVGDGPSLDDGTGDLTDGPESEAQTEEKRLNKKTIKELNREAKKVGVDPGEVEGTGADGAVLKKDLVKAILAAQAAGV